ncbi:hypothetical protein U9M48_011667 [Paspalum notatum var. saurae]|uniref:Uncharacterized protein n=1 Tax=Paspalum notatum var. saurae TaxID=547442 RepID=A0AAQ3WHM0_PASNO
MAAEQVSAAVGLMTEKKRVLFLLINNGGQAELESVARRRRGAAHAAAPGQGRAPFLDLDRRRPVASVIQIRVPSASRSQFQIIWDTLPDPDGDGNQLCYSYHQGKGGRRGGAPALRGGTCAAAATVDGVLSVYCGGGAETGDGLCACCSTYTRTTVMEMVASGVGGLSLLHALPGGETTRASSSSSCWWRERVRVSATPCDCDAAAATVDAVRSGTTALAELRSDRARRVARAGRDRTAGSVRPRGGETARRSAGKGSAVVGVRMRRQPVIDADAGRLLLCAALKAGASCCTAPAAAVR